jgi:hypothetical protein
MNNDRTQPGHLHLTLSLLVEHRALEAAFGEQWSIERRRAILDDYQDTRALADAIEPLFSDVADRKRHLFIDDFLVDTPNRERTKGAGTAPANSTSGNLNDEVVIVFPRRIRWKTEGDDFSLEFGHELRLAANCRMFWFVHSNGSLSYHVSIDLEYRHHHQHYFALSALQKLIYPTEDTRELARGKLPEDSPPNAAHYDAVRVESHENGYRFWDYVERKFEAHLADLLETLKLTERARGQGLYASQFWQKLLLERRLAEYVEAGGDPRRADELPERRLVVLLRDPYFFQLLQAEARAKLTGFEGCFGGRTRDDRSYEISTTDLELIGAHALDYYFLSGYFQNIIDFLRQDTSEVKDGTDPIYPVTGQGDQTSHFVIYASSTSIFEVVSSSRSLEAAHDYIGTCPYLFLVHIMSFHNEVLVRAFERDVGKLVRAMERRGLTPERFKSIRAVQAREVLDEFQRYKLISSTKPRSTLTSISSATTPNAPSTMRSRRCEARSRVAPTGKRFSTASHKPSRTSATRHATTMASV